MCEKMNSTTPDYTTDMADDIWGEKLILTLMIGGPLYLGLILIMVVYTIRRHRQTRNRIENEVQQNQHVRTPDSDAIHFWIPYDDSENTNYVHLGVLNL